LHRLHAVEGSNAGAGRERNGIFRNFCFLIPRDGEASHSEEDQGDAANKGGGGKKNRGGVD